MRLSIVLVLLFAFLSCFIYSRLFMGTHLYREFAWSDEQPFTALEAKSGVRFPLELKRGERMEIRLEQVGADLQLGLFKNGEPVLPIIDSLFGSRGPEWLYFESSRGGTYEIRIYCAEKARADAGYRLRATRSLAADPVASARAAWFASLAAVRAQGYEDPNLPPLQESSAANPGETAWLEAQLAETLGQCAKRRQEFSVAAAAFERASALYQSLGEDELATCSAEMLAEAEARRGDMSAARAAIARAEALAKSGAALGRVRRKWGWLLTERGALEPALLAQRQAEELCGASGDLEGVGLAREESGLLLSQCKQFAAARDKFHGAFLIWEDLGQQERMLRISTENAWSYLLEGNSPAAIDGLQAVIRRSEGAGMPAAEAGAHDRLGSAFRKSGRFVEAEQHYHRALELLGPVRSGSWANVQVNLAELQIHRGSPEAALPLLKEALELYADAQPAARAHALFLQADAMWRSEREEEALPMAKACVAQLSALRDASSGELGRAFLAPRFDYAELLVELLLRFHRLYPERGFERDALQTVESLRARLLCDRYSAHLAEQTRAHELEQRAEKLSREINLNAMERNKFTSQERKLQDKRLRELLLEKQRLRAESSRGTERSIWRSTLAEAQAGMMPDQVALCYWIGTENAYLWALDAQGVQAFELGPASKVKQLVQIYTLSIADPKLARLKSHQARQKRLEVELGRVLLGPVAEDLEGKRLVLVRDGILHQMPFAALIAPGSDRPLATQCAISCQPSLSFAVLARRNRSVGQRLDTREDQEVLIVANARYEPKTPTPTRKRLRNLPGTHKEAEHLSALFSGGVVRLLDLDASLERVRRENLSHYQILHFAAHGMIDKGNMALSSLVFSEFDEKDRSQDGHWRLHEIADLNLNAQLVTLSACRTALGEQSAGDGDWGLEEAFLACGAEQVVASLWQVDDRATAELMRLFYQALLLEKLPADRALAAAQNRLRARPEYQSPYFWAGFLLSGTAAPIRLMN